MIRTLFIAAVLLTLVGCGGSPNAAKPSGKTKVITEVPQPEIKPANPPQVFTPPGDKELDNLKETPIAELIVKLGDAKESDIAARALAARGAEAVPSLMKALESKEPAVCAAAAYALGQCGKHAASAVGALKTVQDKDDSDLARDAAAFAIDAIEGK